MRKNNKGFTLIEMLIVVAIIAILIAVSIPLVNNSLERARVATDAANERAAKAEFMLCYLNGNIGKDADGKDEKFEYDTFYAYDAVSGKLVKGLYSILYSDAYGKCTRPHDPATQAHKGMYLTGKISADGELDLMWYNPTTINRYPLHGIEVTTD